MSGRKQPGGSRRKLVVVSTNKHTWWSYMTSAKKSNIAWQERSCSRDRARGASTATRLLATCPGPAPTTLSRKKNNEA
jgi:hypothetical protein